MSVIIETSRLIIREFLPEEEEIYLKHFTDNEVCLYLPKRSPDERSNIFRTALTNYTSGRELKIWGMFDKADDAFVGSCLLRPFNDEAGKTELGYSMERKYWGKGIGTEMAVAMIAHAFDTKDTQEVVAITDLANIASQRVLEKAGMARLENIVRDGEELAYFKIS